MIKRYAEKQKAKGKSKDPKPDGGGNPSPKKRSSGGSSEQVPKKVRSEKFCQRCKTHGGPHQTHNTSDCRKYDKDGKPLGTAPGKPSDSGKPHKKFWGRQAVGLYDSHVRVHSERVLVIPTVNRKFGPVTRVLE